MNSLLRKLMLLSIVCFVLLECNSCFCKQKMEAGFFINKEVAKVGDTILFINTSSYEEEDSDMNAYWDLGDGNNEKCGVKDTLKYTYNKAGSYTVKLRIGGVECGSDAKGTVAIE